MQCENKTYIFDKNVYSSGIVFGAGGPHALAGWNQELNDVRLQAGSGLESVSAA